MAVTEMIEVTVDVTMLRDFAAMVEKHAAAIKADLGRFLATPERAETREALISAGWTPPGDACACGSIHPGGYACTQVKDHGEPCGA